MFYYIYIYLILILILTGYGKNSNFAVLKRMAKELNGGSEENFKNPHESLELENVYAEIARE